MPLLLLVQRLLDKRRVLRRGKVDARAVLGAPVGSLPVDRRGIDRLKKEIQQRGEGESHLVVLYPHGFGVPRRSGADLLIAWALRAAVGVADQGVGDAPDAAQVFFQSPKTAARQIDFFHTKSLPPICCVWFPYYHAPRRRIYQGRKNSLFLKKGLDKTEWCVYSDYCNQYKKEIITEKRGGYDRPHYQIGSGNRRGSYRKRTAAHAATDCHI